MDFAYSIGTIVLCGIATCFGVESTARQAYELGHEEVLVEDAMASRSGAFASGPIASRHPLLVGDSGAARSRLGRSTMRGARLFRMEASTLADGFT